MAQEDYAFAGLPPLFLHRRSVGSRHRQGRVGNAHRGKCPYFRPILYYRHLMHENGQARHHSRLARHVGKHIHHAPLWHMDYI